jgi:hypothetical protein
MAAAAEQISTLTNFLTDMLGPFTEAFSKRTVMLDELGRNTNRRNFNGLQVRVPIMYNPKQGTGGFAETGGPNAARQVDDNAAFIAMSRVGHAVLLSIDLIRAGRGGNFAAGGDALKLEMDSASTALSRVENEMLCGRGDALIAAVTGAGAATTTVTVGTAANFYQLYPNRVLNVQNRTTGAANAVPTVTIVSQNPAAGTIVVDIALTTATTEGLYIEGTFSTAAVSFAIQGIQQGDATSGTFQGVNLATTPGFRVTDGRGGVVTAADLSIALMDGAYRRVMGASGKSPDFYIGDPAAIDKFSQSLLAQFRWDVKYTRLATGWEGVDYRGTPLIPEFDMSAGVVFGVNKSAISFYGFGNGPEWDDQTGNRFQRFGRTVPVEAWLIDYVQLGVHQPNALVTVKNLNQAT